MGTYEKIVAAALVGNHAAALRLARERLGWSQAMLGRRAHQDRTVISRLESGALSFSDPRAVGRFADALDVPPWVLGGARFAGTPLEGDDVQRRHMLISAGLMMVGVPLGSSTAPPRRVGPAEVARSRELAAAFRAALYTHGGGHGLHRHLGRTLAEVTGFIPHAHHPRVRRDLLAVVGDLAGLTAYAYRDRGHHDDAVQTYLLGLQAARASGQPALVGHLYVRMAGHHIERNAPGSVLDFLTAARQNAADTSTPGERINHFAIEAWARAQMRDLQAVHRSVGHAEDFLNTPSADASGTPWQHHHLSEAEMWSITGAAYTDLARHDRRCATEAVRRLDKAIALRDQGFERNTILDLISLAEAHTVTYDLDQAVSAARRALAQAGGSASLRVRSRLAELSDRLAPYRRRDDVAEVIHLAHVARRGQTPVTA